MECPEWFKTLCDENTTSQAKLVVICRILGIPADFAFRVIPEHEHPELYRADLDGLEVRIRTLLFKRPEEALNALTQLAIETKRTILQDSTARDELRVKIADDILDRVMGKATQTMQIASVSVTADAKDLASIDRDLSLTLRRIETLDAATKLLGGKTASASTAKTTLLSANRINN